MTIDERWIRVRLALAESGSSPRRGRPAIWPVVVCWSLVAQLECGTSLQSLHDVVCPCSRSNRCEKSSVGRREESSRLEQLRVSRPQRFRRIHVGHFPPLPNAVGSGFQPNRFETEIVCMIVGCGAERQRRRRWCGARAAVHSGGPMLLQGGCIIAPWVCADPECCVAPSCGVFPAVLPLCRSQRRSREGGQSTPPRRMMLGTGMLRAGLLALLGLRVG